MSGPFRMARHQGHPSPRCNYSSHTYFLNFYARSAGHLVYGGAGIVHCHGAGTYRFQAHPATTSSIGPTGESEPPPWGLHDETAAAPTSVIKVGHNGRSGTLDVLLSASESPGSNIEIRGRWACRDTYRVGP